MFDSPHPYASPTATHGPSSIIKPAGLPLLSTAPMTAKEREVLRGMARGLRALAELVEDAETENRVDRGLDACSKVAEIGLAAARAGAMFGAGR
jgi:hypothetical protein